MKKLGWVVLLVIATGVTMQAQSTANKTITASDCTAEKLGASIPVTAIGEPVSAVTLSKPAWNEAVNGSEAFCQVEGEMAPVDKSSTARPIKFRVKLPAEWNQRAIQMGGGGLDGTVPDVGRGSGPGFSESPVGFAVYGSDSGHSSTDSEWALNEEAIKNFAYMQLKKTHDAAMVLVERVYGERPKYNYFVGHSEGGREGLTVAQRYPNDYDGVSAGVPVVGISTLMLAPALIRIQEGKLANWVPPAKAKAIGYQIVRKCDGLDGLMDGVINNYEACRAIFNVKGAAGAKDPWKEVRCPSDVDPNPKDESIHACLTNEQIETLLFDFSRYQYATPLANDVKAFGMWAPAVSFSFPMPGGAPGAGARSAAAGGVPGGMQSGGAPGGGPGAMPAGAPGGGGPGAMAGGMPGGMDMSGSAIFTSKRYKGQEGAAADAPVHTHMAGLGVNGMLFQDLNANPLDYIEGGKYNARRVQLSEWLDSTNPDLTAFYRHGGKLMVTIGAMDTTASSGTQLDYYQALIDKMGKETLGKFARLYVSPQGGHGLSGNKFELNGEGKETGGGVVPSDFDQFGMLREWVEQGKAPGMSVTAKANAAGDTMPICSYPEYAKYSGGDARKTSSYTCTTK
jgi:feruloyl esterase